MVSGSESLFDDVSCFGLWLGVSSNESSMHGGYQSADSVCVLNSANDFLFSSGKGVDNLTGSDGIPRP